MSEIRTKPATEEYEKGWERIFSNREETQKADEEETAKSETKIIENTRRDK